MTRTFVLTGLLVVFVGISGSTARASKDETALREGCTWLDRALMREPERDDAFGMFMRGLMPKCHALLEALARGDKSVRPEGLRAVVNEIGELQQVIDAEHGGPPAATGRPTPDEAARKKVADEKAGVDADKAREADEARRADAEKRAAEEAQRRAEQEATERESAEKREAERLAKETEREKKARVAAEKKAEQEARREAKEREAAEKKAAEAARKEAAKRAKEQALEEADARRLIDEAEREAVEEERRIAQKKAAALVEEELSAADAEARRERERLAEENARRVAAERAATANAQTPPARPTRTEGTLDGTWEQPASKVLDRTMKRTLNIFTKDGKVQGELLEEVWFPAPMAWVDRSCEGNTTFRMVTTARVTGEAGKNKLVLWRDIPRVLTCTCPSRCTVETRRRGFDLDVGPNAAQLTDSRGVFVRPGTVIVASASEAALERATPNSAQVVEVSPRSFVGVWETAPFKARDQTLIRRLELSLEGDKLVGTLIERSSQSLPLQSWAERFCQGATKWEWITQWSVDGNSKGTSLTVRGEKGNSLTCSCPSKCTKPKAKFTIKGELGATGETLTVDGELYQKQ